MQQTKVTLEIPKHIDMLGISWPYIILAPNWGSLHPQFSNCVRVPFEFFISCFLLGPSQLLQAIVQLTVWSLIKK